MASTPNQRKSMDNARDRERAKRIGAAQRLLRGTIDRAAEQEAIDAAVSAGQVTRFPPAEREERDETARGHTSVYGVDPSLKTSFGDHSRRIPR